MSNMIRFKPSLSISDLAELTTAYEIISRLFPGLHDPDYKGFTDWILANGYGVTDED